MPKKFPDPAANIHPVATVSADSLADLLWSGADHATVAEYLRTVQDEANANKMAEYLQAIVKAVPIFQAAILAGEGASLQRLAADELVSQLRHLRPTIGMDQLDAYEQRLTAALEDSRRYGLLASARDAAMSILGGLANDYPALFQDPRCELAAKSADHDQVGELRLAIMNFLREAKLEIEVVDGWPRSIRKHHETTRGTVRLVTVEKVKPGLRLPI